MREHGPVAEALERLTDAGLITSCAGVELNGASGIEMVRVSVHRDTPAETTEEISAVLRDLQHELCRVGPTDAVLYR